MRRKESAGSQDSTGTARYQETASRVRFTGPRSIEVEQHSIPQPAAHELLIETEVSAISAGTEGLLYRNEAPDGIDTDEFLPSLDGDLSYPLSYGYACAGRVIDGGQAVDEDWLDTRVFVYHPHASHVIATPETVLTIPDALSLEEATLLANMETAVTFLLDGRPMLGERVLVFGQGVVGLLTTALLAAMPVASLLTVDAYELRREVSEEIGADQSFSPHGSGLESGIHSTWNRGADLVYELSGNPDALNTGIALCGYGGRVIVGSWYGEKQATLDLGGRYHRDRIEIQSSQVSTLPPSVRGRISRERRHHIAWEWLESLNLGDFFTHRFPVSDAPEAYRLLDEHPEETVQVLLTYPSTS